MNHSEIELPSNRKFGVFFASICSAAAGYFFYIANMAWSYIFLAAALLFILITICRSNALLPLNKLWMRFGLLLGVIVSPIVLGVVFFGLFTPVAMLMRLNGRDELGLKATRASSYWIARRERLEPETFKRQF